MIFGNLGKLGDIAGMMKQAKKMKDEMSKARYEAEENGMRVVINGEMKILELILPEKIKADQVKNTINRAIKAASDDLVNKMKAITGGLSLPGL